MLVLSRKLGEQIVLDDNIHITVLAISGSRVCLGFKAPAEVSIRRAEVDLLASAAPGLPSPSNRTERPISNQ